MPCLCQLHRGVVNRHGDQTLPVVGWCVNRIGMDETYIKVKGDWKYLYRAVDKEGKTVDFLLTARRDKQPCGSLKKP